MRRKETAMYTQWIENLVVQRLSLHGGLVLDFDDYNGNRHLLPPTIDASCRRHLPHRGGAY